MRTNKVKRPCLKCIYYNECGDKNRRTPCNGRQTAKVEQRNISVQ